jgi:hypothetical protein
LLLQRPRLRRLLPGAFFHPLLGVCAGTAAEAVVKVKKALLKWNCRLHVNLLEDLAVWDVLM